MEKEQNEEIIEEAQTLHQLSAPTVGKTHDWKQRGPEIICESCETPHGFRIGVNKRLKGFDDKGNLIIENV